MYGKIYPLVTDMGVENECGIVKRFPNKQGLWFAVIPRSAVFAANSKSIIGANDFMIGEEHESKTFKLESVIRCQSRRDF